MKRLLLKDRSLSSVRDHLPVEESSAALEVYDLELALHLQPFLLHYEGVEHLHLHNCALQPTAFEDADPLS